MQIQLPKPFVALKTFVLSLVVHTAPSLTFKLARFMAALSVVALIGFAAGSAQAQDAGTSPTPVITASPVVVTATPPAAPLDLQGDIGVVGQAARDVLHTAQDAKSPKFLIIIAALIALARVFKKIAPQIPVVGGWLGSHPWGDWVVTTTISVGGALLTSIPAGQPIDLGLIISALVAGMAGSGLPTSAAPPSLAAAQAAGTAAATDPGSKLNS